LIAASVFENILVRESGLLKPIKKLVIKMVKEEEGRSN
jgi:hypothetical protein